MIFSTFYVLVNLNDLYLMIYFFIIYTHNYIVFVNLNYIYRFGECHFVYFIFNFVDFISFHYFTGAVHISNPIGRQAKGLAHLNLSYSGLTSKGVNMVAHSLTVNKVI